ncbi:MAG: DUF6580 family putative transport protein [Bacteroidia bacterium]|jgi:hypothetical protein
MNKKQLTIILIIVIAALSRLLPHAPNFTPLTAIALFSGAYIANRLLAIALPLLVMLLSDAIMGFNGWAFTEQIVTVYGTYALISVVSTWFLSHKSAVRVGSSSLLASLLFFLTTNLAVWMGGFFHAPALYPMNLGGIIECYIAALPFFGNALAGDLFYSAVLFGGFYLLSINIPALARERK